MNTQNLIDYRRFARIPHWEMCTWAAWGKAREYDSSARLRDEPRCDCGLGRVIDEYTELVAALEAIQNELGVPQPGYPQPVANAYQIATDVLARVRGEEKQG